MRRFATDVHTNSLGVNKPSDAVVNRLLSGQPVLASEIMPMFFGRDAKTTESKPKPRIVIDRDSIRKRVKDRLKFEANTILIDRENWLQYRDKKWRDEDIALIFGSEPASYRVDWAKKTLRRLRSVAEDKTDVAYDAFDRMHDEALEKLNSMFKFGPKKREQLWKKPKKSLA